MKKLFENLAGRGRVAVALSGGSDSMAMALMAKDAGLDMVALTVDHGLREESAAEAAWVARQMEALGIDHEVLIYKGKIPTSNIEAKARGYRYSLLMRYCKAHGIKSLMVGHNAEEQVETFLLNLIRGSGVKGLSAMRPVITQGGIDIVRPLLGVSKEELREYLRARGQEWAEDPSNEDERYQRVKIRKLAGVFEELGLERDRVLGTIRNLQSADEALSYYTLQAVKNLVLANQGSRIILSSRELERLPQAIAIAALGEIISPGKFIRADSVKRALKYILSGRPCTLGGFRIFHETAGRIVLAKQAAKC